MTTAQEQALRCGNVVLRVAAQHHIAARITSIIRSSQVLALLTELRQPGDLRAMLRLDETLALALGVESVRLERQRGCVAVEVGLPPAMFTPLPLAKLPAGLGRRVALGRSVVNAPVGLELGVDLTPHALVAGTTGSGKSMLLRTLVVQLARQNRPQALRMLLIDGKGSGIRPFARLPHLLHPLITEPSEAVQALAWAVAEVDRRKLEPADWQLVVVIDEIAEIITTTGGKDGQAAQMLARLCQLGRELGVFVVLATQHPTADVLGGTLAKANLPVRLAGRVTDASASTLALGLAGQAAHRLAGRGDFLLRSGSAVQRLQIAQCSGADFDALPQVEAVPVLDLAATPEGTLAATAARAAATSVPDPLTPAQVAWVLAAGMPGIGSIKNGLGVGSNKAGRLQVFCRDLRMALGEAGCEIVCRQDDEEA